MKIYLLRLLLVVLLTAVGAVVGCVSTEKIAEPDSSELISLDAAKNLITSGQVSQIFQPHHGCVLPTLKNGRILTFNQPYLDWVVSFVDEQGLRDTVPVAVE
jgi:hypothetical protein